MKAPSFKGGKLYAELKFSKCRSKVTVKVTKEIKISSTNGKVLS